MNARLVAHLDKWIDTLVKGLVITGALAVLGTGIALAGDDCLSVRLKAPIMLPDGTIHDASRLTLCTSRDLSPVTRLHVISLNGKAVGLVRSRMGVSEGPARTTPMVMFRRLESGVLDLVGYAVPDGARDRTFVIQPPLRARPAAAPQIAQSVRAVAVDPPQASASSVALALTLAAD